MGPQRPSLSHGAQVKVVSVLSRILVVREISHCAVHLEMALTLRYNSDGAHTCWGPVLYHKCACHCFWICLESPRMQLYLLICT